MDVNEHERQSNITQIKGKEHRFLIAVLNLEQFANYCFNIAVIVGSAITSISHTVMKKLSYYSDIYILGLNFLVQIMFC